MDIILKIQNREICVEKRLSELAQVKSKVKETRRRKDILQNRGEGTNGKNRRECSGKGNVKP